MSEYWSDDDDCISWRSLCLSEYRPNEFAGDEESAISLQDIASDVLYPIVDDPICGPLIDEVELQSSSSWVFPTQPPRGVPPLPALTYGEVSIPVDLSTRAALRTPMHEPTVILEREGLTRPIQSHSTPLPPSLVPLPPPQSPSISLLDMFKNYSPSFPADPVHASPNEANDQTPTDRAKCLSLESKVHEMETNKIELQSKCAALEMKLKALTVRLHESSTNHSMEVRSLEGEQARLKTQLQTKQAQMEALEDSHRLLRSQLLETQVSLREQSHVNELHLRALRDEDMEQKRIVSTLEAKVDNLLARVAEKDRKIHSDGEALAAKLKELETLREQFHDLSAAHDALKDTQRQNSVEMERLRKECFKAQYELSHRRATETRPPQPPPPPAFLHQPLSPKLGEAMQPVETRRLPPPPPPPEKSKSLAEMGFGQFIRKPDELNSSTNVRNLLSYHHSPRSQDHVAPHRVDTNVSAPFATEMQTFQNDVVARRELEAQLLHWHIQKEQLQAEYTKLEQMGCRSIQARRRKSDIETSLNSVDRHINQLKFRLRS